MDRFEIRSLEGKEPDPPRRLDVMREGGTMAFVASFERENPSQVVLSIGCSACGKELLRLRCPDCNPGQATLHIWWREEHHALKGVE